MIFIKTKTRFNISRRPKSHYKLLGIITWFCRVLPRDKDEVSLPRPCKSSHSWDAVATSLALLLPPTLISYSNHTLEMSCIAISSTNFYLKSCICQCVTIMEKNSPGKKLKKRLFSFQANITAYKWNYLKCNFF